MTPQEQLSKFMNKRTESSADSLILQANEFSGNEKLKRVTHLRTISFLKFDEIVLILSYLFGEKSSELQKCFKYLSFTKELDEG